MARAKSNANEEFSIELYQLHGDVVCCIDRLHEVSEAKTHLSSIDVVLRGTFVDVLGK